MYVKLFPTKLFCQPLF